MEYEMIKILLKVIVCVYVVREIFVWLIVKTFPGQPWSSGD